MTHLYPADWPEIARTVKAANDYTCQMCGQVCRRPGQFYLGWRYELTLAHLTQDYDAEAVTVAALCAPCHLAHDAPLSWVARRRRLRLLLHNGGQLAFALR